MAKALSLGNGNILVNLDHSGQLRDFYFPYVGLENHVGGDLVHRVGIWVDGQLAWTSGGEWQIEIASAEDAPLGLITATHQRLGVELKFRDSVYNEKNIFLRHVVVRNLADQSRTIKVFFGQQFEMYQSPMAHTAYYDPERAALIHYRNERVFLANAQLDGRGFDMFTTGVFLSEGKEGSHLDAADGRLEANPIEHGRADSVLGLGADYEAGQSRAIFYWLAVGHSIAETRELNDYVLSRGAGHLIETTANYWRAWVNRREFIFHGLSPAVVGLFKRSLFLIRAHANSNGGIIASCDFANLQQGKDTYNYIWPRDASYAALALARAGDHLVAQRFFAFADRVIAPEGHFMHKYSPDMSLGSSWHPWLRHGQLELPIQEDETALVIFSLWRYYEITKDLEFIEQVYNSLIKRAADFMVVHRDPKTKLPKPSYDLWEEKFGVSTFTAAAVYGALEAAARFAKLLGKVKNEDVYRATALEVKEGILRHLYDESAGYFYKLLNLTEGQLSYDPTVDISSVYALYHFKVLPADDALLAKVMKLTEERLLLPLTSGGVARYEGDAYHHREGAYAGNAWFVTTLWRAQYYIQRAQSEADLAPVKEALEWTVSHAQSSGLLSEQLDPYTGHQVSVSPLVWSHAEFVLTVLDYLDKLEQLGVCKACNPTY